MAKEPKDEAIEEVVEAAPQPDLQGTYYDVYYIKMILDRIPDGTALSGDTTVRDIIASIVAGQRPRQ